MKKDLVIGAWLAVTLVAMPAWGRQAPTDIVSPVEVAPSQDDSDVGLAREAQRLFQAGEPGQAANFYERFMATGTFKQAPVELQRNVRTIYLQSLLLAGRGAEAYAPIKSASQSDATGDDWLLRMEAAYRLEDRADALTSLATFARRWPARLSTLDDGFIFTLVNLGQNRPPLRDLHTQAMLALYESKWVPQDPFTHLDAQRFLLADALAEQGRLDKAREVAATINYTTTVADMRMLRRFDPIISPSQRDDDLGAVADRYIQSLKIRGREDPDKLEGINELASQLYSRGRLADALAVTDDAIVRAMPTTGVQSPFRDMDQLIWTYDRKARVLLMMGRGDDAVAAMRAGAARLERGADNISQALNLAAFYVELDRPRDALTQLEASDKVPASGYGKMVREELRADAYVLLHDDAKLKAPLDYIKAHKADAPRALMNVLLDAGDEDGAAKEIVALLKDPQQQGALLRTLQDYITPDTAPATMKAREARMRRIRERPDVKAAISACGRILSLPFLAP